MKLTERQCWDCIRSMVSAKNDEYSSLLYSFFDTEQMKEIVGFTRDTFLSKMAFKSLAEFKKEVKINNNTVATQWLDNLSSEDLLLFLDFRCRSLQNIYDYYKSNNGKISKDNIKNIVQNTKVAKIKSYNYGRLKCTGKPKRVEGEKKIGEIYLHPYDVQKTAIIQVLFKMINKYSDILNINNDEIKKVISEITTSNINLRGNLTGHRFNGYLDIYKQLDITEQEDLLNPKFIGLDIQGSPVYECEDGYYNSIGKKLDEEEFIYTRQDIDLFDL